MEESIKALVVDDEEVLRHMVARILKSMGIESEPAVDGLDAIEKLGSGRFQVVIADVRMPNMDGIQLLKHVQRNLHGIDVIIMTAHTSQYSFIDVIEAGAVDFITKPFSVEELKAKVERVLRERETDRELLKKTEGLEAAYTALLSLKDDKEKAATEINYERAFLQDELGKLKKDNLRLNQKIKGIESN